MHTYEVFICKRWTPDIMLQHLMVAYKGKSGRYERITPESFEAHWKGQDRFDRNTSEEQELWKSQIKKQVAEGEPWFWFDIHS